MLILHSVSCPRSTTPLTIAPHTTPSQKPQIKTTPSRHTHHRMSPRKKIVELKLLLSNNYYENAYVLWNNYSIEKIQFQNSFSGNIFFILRNSCSKSIYVLWNNYSIIEKIPLRYSFLGKKFYYGTIVLKVYWCYGTNIL